MARVWLVFGMVSTVVLSGCAAKLIASNERTVIINAHSSDPAGAIAIAQQECSKYDRHARLSEKPRGDRQWTFDCIK